MEKENPSVRYLALQHLQNLTDDKEVKKARKAAYTKGAIGKILNKMQPEGYWFKPGYGYSPKYKGTVWSLIALSQIGAKVNHDGRVQKACMYYLDHGLGQGGKFGFRGSPSSTVDCLQGNMCAALKEMGMNDPRLDEAYDWLARSTTGDGVYKYYAYKCGPKFACGINGGNPCAWGAVKTMLALSKIPEKQRTLQMRRQLRLELISYLVVIPLQPTTQPKMEQSLAVTGGN